MDIKLAHGRTGRIGIHRGDDPRVLAQNFANAFHLDAKLTGMESEEGQREIDKTKGAAYAKTCYEECENLNPRIIRKNRDSRP